MRKVFGLLLLTSLGACSSLTPTAIATDVGNPAVQAVGVALEAGSPAATKAIATGQLVCKVGPTLLAMYSGTTPILAKGALATFVADVCAVFNGLPAPAPGA